MKPSMKSTILTTCLVIPIYLACVNSKLQTVASGRVFTGAAQLVKQWHNNLHPHDKYTGVDSIKLVEHKPTGSNIEAWTIKTISSQLYTYRVVILGDLDSSLVQVGNFENALSKP